MPSQRDLALAVLREDGDIVNAARRTETERSTVAAAARRHGWPDLARMRAALRDQPDLRVRAVGLAVAAPLIRAYDQAMAALEAAVLAAEADAAAEEARVTALEEKRAAVEQMRVRLERGRAELAALEAGAAPAKVEPERTGPTNAELRAWAAEQGIECPARGKIPGRVREAWQEANPDE